MKKLSVLIIVVCLLFSSTTVVALQKQSTISINNDKTTSQSNFNDIIPSLLEQLDESMILSYIEDIVDITEKYPIRARVTGTAGCKETAEYIQEQFAEMGLDVKHHDWSARGKFDIWEWIKFKSWNVEATLPGIDERSEEIYIISAHYDTVFSTPGADDNAAGIAAVISAAKILSQYEFNHTIRFVAFSGEEQGFLGSEAYTKDAYASNDNLIATINLDMIGYTETEEDSTKIRIYEDESSDWIGDLSVALNHEYYDYIGFDEVVRSYDSTGHGSDYRTFWKSAYNAVFNHEYKWNPNKDTPEDTIENMDVAYATKVTRFMLATIATLAMSPVIDNTQPNAPISPDGELSPKINLEYTYTTSAIDPDGDEIYYLFDWGDGTNSGWIGPYASGEIGQASHSWTEKGSYSMKVKAKDIHGIQSGWSDTHSITMPRSLLFENHLFLIILQKFFDLFLFS